MKRKLDKTLALKLINQYADNYKRVEEENKSLQKEINDLKSNLNVNKEIIESFFKNDKTKLEAKANLYIAKTKEEIDTLNKRNEELMKDNSDLRIKVLKYETVINDSLSKYKTSTTEMSNKLFVMENALKKKNNIIEWLKKKIQNLKEAEFQYDYYNDSTEIYIADPNETLNIIYNDLLLYKQAYENSLNKIKENKIMIDGLQTKLAKKTSPSKEDNNSPKSTFATTTKALNEMILKCTRKDWETDEWLAILNYLNMTKEDIKNNSQSNKFISKLFDGIELLNKIVVLRNKKINELTKEKEKLKESNTTLTNENVMLMKNVLAMKMQQNKDDVNEQYINTNISMVNNISFEEQKQNKNLKHVSLIKQDILKGLINKGTGSGVNNSMTLDNNNLSLSMTGKNLNFTQVSESSFGIIDTDDMLGKLNLDTKEASSKQLKKIKFSDSFEDAENNNNSIVMVNESKIKKTK